MCRTGEVQHCVYAYAAAWQMQCGYCDWTSNPVGPMDHCSAAHVFGENLKQAIRERKVLADQLLALVEKVIENLQVFVWLLVGGQVS